MSTHNVCFLWRNKKNIFFFIFYFEKSHVQSYAFTIPFENIHITSLQSLNLVFYLGEGVGIPLVSLCSVRSSTALCEFAMLRPI